MVTLIIGKICSGKTTLARRLAREKHALLLSADELMTELFHHNEGEHFDLLSSGTKRYLHKKTLELARLGVDVILDWGFWTRSEREEVTRFYRESSVEFEWIYVDTPRERWLANIALRNELVGRGESEDYYVDAGLLAKLESRFELPTRGEVDVWYVNE